MISPRWRKVLRDLWDNRSRTALVVLSIAVGMIAFGGLLLTRQTFQVNTALDYANSNANDIVISLPRFDDTLIPWAARQPYVTGALGLANRSAKLTIGANTYDVALHGYAGFTTIPINKLDLQSGTWPSGSDEIALERSNLPKTGAHLGDTLTIVLEDGSRRSEHAVHLVGIIHDLNVQPGFISTTVNAYTGLRTLYNAGLTGDYNTLYLTVDRSASAPSVSQIATNLRESLRERGLSDATITVNLDRKYWASDTLNGIFTVLTVVGLLSLIFSGFLVVNTISGSLTQQRRQIGIMKIVGASRGQIITVYLVMVACFGALALAIALPISVGIAAFITNAMGPVIFNFDIVSFGLPVNILALEVAVAFIVSGLAALAPILSTTRLTAAQAIREADATKATRLDMLLASIRRLPRPFLFSLRNTFRRRARLIMTVITLTLAGSLFIAILNVREGVNQFIQSSVGMSNFDVQLLMGGSYDKASLEQRALKMLGVTATEGWVSGSARRVRTDGVQGAEFQFYGLSQDTQFAKPDIANGRWLNPSTRDNRYEVVVTTQWLKDEPGSVGDSITLTRTGRDTTQAYTIVGVVEDQAPAIYTYFNTAADFLGTGETANILLVRTQSRTLAGEQAAANVLSTSFAASDLNVAQVNVGQTFIQAITTAFGVVIALLLGSSVMIAIVGGLGLTGTMSLNVLERTREVGVMRSIGAATNTLRRIFITEGILIGLISFVLAVLLSFPASFGFGAVLGVALRGRAIPPAITPLGSVIWLTIIVIVATLASVLPAQRATQISIREALSYE